MATLRRLFIEGDSRLSQGFNKLIAAAFRGMMPRIVMGENKSETIKKFLRDTQSTQKILLIDLDLPETERETDLRKWGLSQESREVFYMVQEMEAWFLSQPNVLKKYWKDDIGHKIATRDVKVIEKPSALLAQLSKNTRKGVYDKVRDGANLLMLLDAPRCF